MKEIKKYQKIGPAYEKKARKFKNSQKLYISLTATLGIGYTLIELAFSLPPALHFLIGVVALSEIGVCAIASLVAYLDAKNLTKKHARKIRMELLKEGKSVASAEIAKTMFYDKQKDIQTQEITNGKEVLEKDVSYHQLHDRKQELVYLKEVRYYLKASKKEEYDQTKLYLLEDEEVPLYAEAREEMFAKVKR